MPRGWTWPNCGSGCGPGPCCAAASSPPATTSSTRSPASRSAATGPPAPGNGPTTPAPTTRATSPAAPSTTVPQPPAPPPWPGPHDQQETRILEPLKDLRGAALAPGVLVGGAGTRRGVQALVAAGWSQAQLAGQLMTSPGRVGVLLREERVTAGKAAAVRELYERLWSPPPPDDDPRTRIAASRARNHAAVRGWAPPMAWDDEELDKADGPSAEGWRRRTSTRGPSAELAEDAAELFRQDYTPEQAADRLGATKGAVHRALGRAQRREARGRLTAQAEHEAQRSRFAEAPAAAEEPARQAEAG